MNYIAESRFRVFLSVFKSDRVVFIGLCAAVVIVFAFALTNS